MGEYAEMMLDGTCCQQCGDFIGSDNGFPTFCAGCASEVDDDFTHIPVTGQSPLVSCDICGKRVKAVGLAQHKRAKHAAEVRAATPEGAGFAALDLYRCVVDMLDIIKNEPVIGLCMRNGHSDVVKAMQRARAQAEQPFDWVG